MRKRFGSGVCALAPGFRVARVLLALMFVFGSGGRALAQMETATLSGTVTDPTGAVVAGAEVRAVRIDTGTNYVSTTNTSGLYLIVGLQPGHFRIFVTKQGFKQIELTDVTLNVQDTVNRNFSLEVGAASETVTVRANDLHINTTDATVSTVVDRQFAENLPMNGRSFQTLIQLTPGVVLTPTNASDSGQFSVNGQRAVSNYWMVDGVGANIGVGGFTPSNGFGGALGAFSAQGGTNSLVSVDAMQEFRILTSTYAPEFGRTPGGQISIVTRSGTNQWHGSAFDYLRNDLFDANDWFADANRLPKPQERQNDFGGTFGGPILKDHTFFFFSYEGLRLRLPQVALTTVPDSSNTSGGLNARATATTAVQPFLNAYPLPNGPEVFTPCTPNVNGCPASGEQPTGSAQFNASFSNKSTLDASSIRIDHKLGAKLSLFGRYNYSPSSISQRGFFGTALNTISPTSVTTQTVTVGTIAAFSAATANDLRFNYSRVDSSTFFDQDSFGGGIPLTSLPIPNGFSTRNASFLFAVGSLGNNGEVGQGKLGRSVQHQFNLVDDLTLQKDTHSLKFGVDFRRLSPLFSPPVYSQLPFFLDVPSAIMGNPLLAEVSSAQTATLLFHNLGVFAQDTWRVIPRLTVTYGLRWDTDFAPSAANGPNLPAITNYNLSNLSNLALAPAGTPPFYTQYGNVAPRLGIAYQLLQSQNWQTVIRGGFGVFYDLATSEVGNGLYNFTYPFGAMNFMCCFNVSFPLTSAEAAPPAILPPNATNPPGALYGFDPNLKLPYTLQWNAALEQALGRQQIVSISYVASAGRRLISTANVSAPNANFGGVILTTNAGTSDYDALQVQFQRRLSHRLQALASYTWAHSIDTGSAGSFGVASNALVPASIAQSNRGSSDFDVRSAFSAGMTYDIPAPKINPFTNAILRGWSLQNILQARSAPPVTVSSFVYNNVFITQVNGYLIRLRPDVVPGQPLYLYGPQYPGGKAINPAAFTAPPINPITNVPLRNGNLGRNALRGFGATQWDFGVHRDFPIRESSKLQFRAEMFNILNHPNFGQPDGTLADPTFGKATQMLGQSLAGGYPGNGSFSALYQIGGPRSVQFALKFMF